MLRKGWASGAILFSDNITSPAQLRALTKTLRSGRAAGATPIVCTDQEGGVIRNVDLGAARRARSPPRSPAATPRRRRGAARPRASTSRSRRSPTCPRVNGAAMAGRAFSRDPQRGPRARPRPRSTAGSRAASPPTAKHFPGLGGATVNTDHGSATIGGGAPTRADLAPFEAAIAAKVPLIMSSHAVYPRLDADRIAAQSPRDPRRRCCASSCGFEGVVITDTIEAAAVRATGSTEQIAVRSIRAGNDIVLTTGQGSWIRAYRALLAEARASRSFRARVKASAARVLALQQPSPRTFVRA